MALLFMCQFVSTENVSQSMSDTHQAGLMVLVAYSIYIFQRQRERDGPTSSHISLRLTVLRSFYYKGHLYTVK